MNHIAKTLLNVMRIEVLLGIGLVVWVFSLEARSAPATELLEVEIAIMDCTILEKAVDREYSASNANRPPNIPFNIQLCSELITFLKDEWLALGLNPATKFFAMIGGSGHRATVSTLSDLERQRNRATTERRKDFLLREEAFLPYREMLPILIEPNGDKDFQETKNFAVTSGDAFVAKSLAEKLANEQQKAVVLTDVQGKHNGGVSSEDKEAMMRISFSGLDVRGSQRRRFITRAKVDPSLGSPSTIYEFIEMGKLMLKTGLRQKPGYIRGYD